MATKAELLEKAQEAGLDVKTSDTKAELESKLGSDANGNTTPVDSNPGTAPEYEVEDVTVNENEGGEATNGTTQEGDDSPIENSDSIPQNGVTTVNTFDDESDRVSTVEDESRTAEEVEFADESNPNNKARTTGAGGSAYDQDGNIRTGGKSYGVAADNPENDPSFFSGNAGEAPEGRDLVPLGSFYNPVAGEEGDTNNQEWDDERREALEDSLADESNNVKAHVSTSVGNYVRVKFFRNGFPLGTYKSRDFDESKASAYRDSLTQEV